MYQRIYKLNEHHLCDDTIKTHLSIDIPEQTIVTYRKGLLTPTNHIFVKSKYIPTGLIKGHDDKQLHRVTLIYLYTKCKYFLPIKNLASSYIWCYDDWSGNYYHWMCETLPRIYQVYLKKKATTTLIPIEYIKKSFITESLVLLNIDYTAIDQKKTHIINELLTVQTEPRWSIIHPLHQIKLVSAIKEALQIHDNKSFRKIYISRSKATYRHIVNETEIIPILEKNGYEIVSTETLTFKEQVMLFSETKALISLHGAGQTNMMFMPKGGKSLELRNKTMSSQPFCYFELANIFELKWDYFITEAIGEETNFNDVQINTIEFEHFLNIFETDEI